jgi:Rad3-related DNA helicase
MGYEQTEKLSCYATCDYLQNRKRAIEQPISLLNYAFWLIQRNYVAAKMEQDDRKVPFEQRDFVFFDEAHRIDDIVQSHFSPRIEPNLIEKIMASTRFANKHGFQTASYTKHKIEALVNDMMTGNKSDVYAALVEFEVILRNFGKVRQTANQQVKKRYGSIGIPKDWQTAFASFDRIKDVHCKIEDYLTLINEVGVSKMVLDQNQFEAKFMCVEESHMINKYLHNKADFKVFMSATIGDPRSFVKIMGIKNAKFIRMDNMFNYDKSPVVFVNRHKLSYKEREESLPKVVEILDQIISKHKGQRGVIHTGSYAFTNYIRQHSKHSARLIDYENSKQKADMLDLFKKKKGAVLMGPSLLEGLDLKDDTSRFQIFFKVPYPSLGDPLIKAKMQTSNEWYDWKTVNQISQGIGRSVRSADDWAVTYVLDACFRSVIPHFKHDEKFMNRLKIIK